jgi:hypothetical protein
VRAAPRPAGAVPAIPRPDRRSLLRAQIRGRRNIRAQRAAEPRTTGLPAPSGGFASAPTGGHRGGLPRPPR